MMNAIKTHGLEDPQHTSQFLLSLSKASSFDMTMMFMSSAEKKDLAEILRSLKSAQGIDKTTLSKLESTYSIS